MEEIKTIGATPTWTDGAIMDDIIKKIPSYADPQCNYVDKIEVTIILKRVGKNVNIKGSNCNLPLVINCTTCSHRNLSKHAKPCTSCIKFNNHAT